MKRKNCLTAIEILLYHIFGGTKNKSKPQGHKYTRFLTSHKGTRTEYVSTWFRANTTLSHWRVPTDRENYTMKFTCSSFYHSVWELRGKNVSTFETNSSLDDYLVPAYARKLVSVSLEGERKRLSNSCYKLISFLMIYEYTYVNYLGLDVFMTK